MSVVESQHYNQSSYKDWNIHIYIGKYLLRNYEVL